MHFSGNAHLYMQRFISHKCTNMLKIIYYCHLQVKFNADAEEYITNDTIGS